MSDIAVLEAAIGHHFGDGRLLEQALTHRSYGTPHNERLEYLGDGVLNCVMARLLFERFPDFDEGKLSRLRANLVCQDALFAVANDLNIGNYLRLGGGEMKSGGWRRPSILADAVEAILGAISVDASHEAAAETVRRLFAQRLDTLDLDRSLKDAKTRLQEYLQGKGLGLPEYVLQGTSGEAHCQQFAVLCQVASLKARAEGTGSSRRGAEQAAAEALLQQVAR